MLWLQGWRGKQLDVIVATMEQPAHFCNDARYRKQQQQQLEAAGSLQPGDHPKNTGSDAALQRFVRCVAVATWPSASLSDADVQQLQQVANSSSSSGGSSAAVWASDPEELPGWPRYSAGQEGLWRGKRMKPLLMRQSLTFQSQVFGRGSVLCACCCYML